jgi:hypothetical protein
MMVAMSLSPVQEKFVDWLLTPKHERTPSTQSELAAELSVSPNKLTAWKRDADFLESWNGSYLSDIGSPEKKSIIMQTLYGTATDPDDPKHVQAAEKYFAIEGSLRPTNRNSLDITVASKPASDLTDEELQRMLASKAGDELGRRRQGEAG